MKGSDKWGEGRGPRIEVVLGALIIVSLVGVYLFYLEDGALASGGQSGGVTTVSTTGVVCDSAVMPGAAQQAEQDPAFTNLSDGLCYNYLGESPMGGAAAGGYELSFAYYNDTIDYPCGDAPLQLPQSEIQVQVDSRGVASAQLVSPSQNATDVEACDPSIPLKVVSVADVESTIPAVPQLNVTLAVPPGGASIATLKAVLTLDGGSQTFKFGGVTPTSLLGSAASVSSTEIVLSNLSFNASEVYPMTISGTFQDGHAFGYVVHVQIAQVP